MEITGWDDLRPGVRDFALAMERRLRENEHKPGWERDSWGTLLTRLQEQTYSLWHKLTYGANAGIITNQAADVANYAMMLADISGGISYYKPEYR